MTMLNLGGRVALITGASSGIGKATALLLAEHGAKIAGLSRSRGELERAMALIRDNGGEALTVVADISRPQQMAAGIEKIIETWGRLDIVFANAGINGVWAPIEDLKPEEFRKTLDINLWGTFITVKYAVPHLRKRGGAVVITSSVNGTRKFSNTGATAYSASKAGQIAMMKMLALELAADRVRVNAVSPGAISTQIEEEMVRRDLKEAGEPVVYPEGKIPLTDGKRGTPEEVARLVLFLVSDASSHITGTNVVIDGAETLIQA
ncbi:MAG: SDR family oxidoreductase [Anaerolineae bacterium]